MFDFHTIVTTFFSVGRRSRSFGARSMRCIVFWLATVAVASAQETAPTSVPAVRVTAAELRAPAPEVAGEAEIPQWVFWKLVREAASSAADRAAESQASLNDPLNFDFVAEKIRKTVGAAGANVPDFVDKFATISSIDLGRAEAPCAVLKRLTLSEDAHLIRNAIADSRSPAADIKDVALRSIDDWVVDAASDFKGALYAAEMPNESIIRSAAKRGIKAIIVRTPHMATDPDFDQYARPSIVFDGKAGLLPLPIVYVSFVNDRQIVKNLGSANGLGALLIQRPSVDESRVAKMLVVSIKGRNPERRLVVSCGRSIAVSGLEAGSRGLDFAAWLEVLRVTASFVARRPNQPPLANVDFVFVADAGSGFDFLTKVVSPTDRLIGVVDLANVAPMKPQSNSVFLSLLADRGTSVVENAFCGVLARWLGRESAWRNCAVRLTSPKDWEGIARSFGHERIPFIGVGGTTGAGTIAADEHPAVLPTMRSAKDVDAVSGYVGTCADELPKLVDTNVSHTCMVVRAAVFGILRTMRTEF